MRIDNFKVEKGHAISRGPHWIDLHNDYVLEDIKYDEMARVLRVAWRCSRPSPLNDGASICLVFQSVSLLIMVYREIAGRDPGDPGVLSFVGFLHPDSTDVMDGYLDAAEADESYHFIIGFERGLSVKCFCDTITCSYAL